MYIFFSIYISTVKNIIKNQHNFISLKMLPIHTMESALISKIFKQTLNCLFY